jgi:hypothetical protein
MKVSDQLRAQAALTQWKEPLVRRASLDAVVKGKIPSPYQVSNHRSFNLEPSAIPLSYLGSSWSFSYSRILPPFVETEGSLPRSQQPASDTHPESHASSLYIPPYFVKMSCNNVLPSTPRSSEWCVLFRFSDQNFVCISHFSNECYVARSSNRP